MAKTAATQAKARKAGKQEAAAAAGDGAEHGRESALMALAHQLRGWTDSVLGIAGAAADVSLNVAKSMLPKPQQKAALEKAGAAVRGMREAAGLSVKELGEAINLKDPALLELVEHGKVALPFEIVLRLAAVLGRNDPIPFLMKLARTYNPEVWRTLENLGVGRLVVHAGREHEVVNIYRSNDAARRLSDEDFAAVLDFTRTAFEMAVTFRMRSPARKPRNDMAKEPAGQAPTT
jgi:transcriptional regulator with XRE-family HTH domain